MFKISYLLFATLLLFTRQGLAQLERDASGNPVITQPFVEEVIQPMEFQNMDGESLTLSRFKGKIVIIDFWQTWCKPCLDGFRGLQKAKEEWPDYIEILAASPDWADNKRKIKRFMKKNPYDFHFIWAGELEEQLSLSSIPYKIILAPDGSLIQSKSGTSMPAGEYAEVNDAGKPMVIKWFSESYIDIPVWKN